ncbi:MAG: response regulator, partial [Calditrichaeota bacterium]
QARQLHRAIAAAEDASRAKSAFLANMSHELRTPLNGVIGMLELLKHTDLSEEQQEYLSIAETSAQTLLHIINDILDLSRIEAGKVTLSPERFEFRRWLEESLRPLRASAEQKGLSFVCEVAEGVPEYVVGDPLRLRQILVNLVGNAVKFTQAGSVAVRVSVDEAGKQDVEDARQVALRFVVQDTGVGIPPEKLEHIFDRFEQVDDSLTRSYQGTGLGLAISRHLVEMMGGRIWAESPAPPTGQPPSAEETVPLPGPGSAFYFTVLLEAASLPEDAENGSHPVSAAPETAASVAEQAEEHPPPEDRLSREAPSPSRLRILLAEDNRINQRVAQRMLEKMGHEVIIAANGKEAVELLEKESVDVVLMDVQMPEMDGFTATEIIRQREKETGKHVPIIALTAHAMKGDRERCLEAGMDGYLTKPLKQKALRQALAQLVSPVSVEDPKLHATMS